LIVAFATTTKQLRTIRVAIKWGNKTTEKGVNPAQITVNPTILVGHLAVTNWMDVNPTDGSEYLAQSSMSSLSHFEILPPSPDSSGGQASLPTIMTVRSYLPASPSQFNQNIESVIDRWELRELPQPVHSAFEQLTSRRGSTGSQPAVSRELV
jgi:mediator of RNA polymerase II transcription subunit 16